MYREKIVISDAITRTVNLEIDLLRWILHSCNVKSLCVFVGLFRRLEGMFLHPSNFDNLKSGNQAFLKDGYYFKEVPVIWIFASNFYHYFSLV